MTPKNSDVVIIFNELQLNKQIFLDPIKLSEHRARNIIVFHSNKVDITSIKESFSDYYDEIISISLPSNIDSGVTEYERIIKDDFLSILNEYTPTRQFVISTHKFDGVQTQQENSEKLSDLIKTEVNNTKLTNWTGVASETLVGMTILNFILMEYYTKVHYIITDSIECDITQYLYNELFESYVIRHNLHPLLNKSNVVVNNTPLSFECSNTNEKNYEFFVGINPINDSRVRFLNDLVNNIPENSKIISKFIGQEKYWDFLADSKSTLIIPSKNENFFPTKRFVEAIIHNCVPIVWEADFYKAFVGYGDLIKYIDENLYVENFEDLNTKIKYCVDNYEKIIKDLLNTSYFKELYDQKIITEKINTFYL